MWHGIQVSHSHFVQTVHSNKTGNTYLYPVTVTDTLVYLDASIHVLTNLHNERKTSSDPPLGPFKISQSNYTLQWPFHQTHPQAISLIQSQKLFHQTHPQAVSLLQSQKLFHQTHPQAVSLIQSQQLFHQTHPQAVSLIQSQQPFHQAHPQATHFHSTQSDLSVHQADIQECENL